MKRQFKKAIYLSIDDIIENCDGEKLRVTGVHSHYVASARLVSITTSDNKQFGTSGESDIEIFKNTSEHSNRIMFTNDQQVAINTAIRILKLSNSDHAEQSVFYLNQLVK